MIAPTLKDIAALYEEINAMGGRAQTEYDAGSNNAIEQTLFMIEQRFKHVHVAAENDMCGACGLHLYHDIHERVKQ